MLPSRSTWRSRQTDGKQKMLRLPTPFSVMEEWVEKLSRLVEDADLGRSLGEKGRQRVESHYWMAVRGERFAAVPLWAPKRGRE